MLFAGKIRLTAAGQSGIFTRFPFNLSGLEGQAVSWPCKGENQLQLQRYTFLKNNGFYISDFLLVKFEVTVLDPACLAHQRADDDGQDGGDNYAD